MLYFHIVKQMISYCCANELNRRVRHVSKKRNGEQGTGNKKRGYGASSEFQLPKNVNGG